MTVTICEKPYCAEPIVHVFAVEGTKCTREVCTWHERWAVDQLRSDFPGFRVTRTILTSGAAEVQE